MNLENLVVFIWCSEGLKQVFCLSVAWKLLHYADLGWCTILSGKWALNSLGHNICPHRLVKWSIYIVCGNQLSNELILRQMAV